MWVSPANLPPIPHGVSLYYKKKTKSTGNSRRFLFFMVSCLLKNGFLSSAPPSSSCFPGTPLSHDTMTKKNALVALFSRFNEDSTFYLVPKAPCANRARQGFMGLNYLPKIDQGPRPGKQASPHQLPRRTSCVCPGLQSSRLTPATSQAGLGCPRSHRHPSPFLPQGIFQ